MGAGCTVSASSKAMINAAVSSPQKKKVPTKSQEQSHLTNFHEQNDHSQISSNQQNLPQAIDSPDYSPKFDDSMLKQLQIGKYLVISPKNSNLWSQYLPQDTESILLFLQNAFSKNTKYFKYAVEKSGPLEGYRWESWRLIFNLVDKKNSTSHSFYDVLVHQDCKNDEEIKKDIFRTFPTHPYFSEQTESNEINTVNLMSLSLGNMRLYRVLKVIANYYPNVGYCQGMNFILGFLLVISGGKECQVFEMFLKMAEHPKFRIIGFYENGFPLLRLYCFIFYKLLNKRQAKLAKYLKKIDLPDSLWLTKWILTMLVYSFPFELSIRLWDYIIASQSLFSLIKVCIELLKSLSKHLYTKDSMEIAEFLREIIEKKQIINDPKSEIYINPEKIIKNAKKIKISDKMIGKWTEEFINTLEKVEEKENTHLVFYKSWASKKSKQGNGKADPKNI